MAPFSLTTTTTTSSITPSFSISISISCFPFSPFPTSSRLPFHPLSTVLRPVRCRASAPGPPPPPQTDPSPGKLQDLAASLSKVQDRVQIFFAVLFWMSLFFWASAWDGRNRPNKGSRFRR